MQIDGSPHDWFEDRGPRCTLIVFIDDATGEWMALRFVAAETTQAYMQTLWTYLSRHASPLSTILGNDAVTSRCKTARQLKAVGYTRYSIYPGRDTEARVATAS